MSTNAWLIVVVYTLGCMWIGFVFGFKHGAAWYKRLRDQTDAIIKRHEQDRCGTDASDWWKRNP